MYKSLPSLVALALASLCATTASASTSVVPVAVAVKKGPTPDIPFPDYNAIITCTAQACSGTCSYTPLADLGADECYTTFDEFESAMVYTIGNVGLDFGVYVGLELCEEATQLDDVETCYNVLNNGVSALFSSFYIT